MGYYIGNQGVQEGPFELNDLPEHGLRAESLVWTEGMPDWKRADAVPEVAALLAPAAPMQPVVEPAPVSVPPQPTYAPLPPQAPQMMSYQTPPIAQNNGMAVASMVLGIISFPASCFYLIGTAAALLAIIFGFVARGKIKRGETLVGSGMALAGIILGIVHFALIVLAVIVLMIIGIAVSMHKP
jgi:hypothetical protein